jgi:hypothetical protein
MARKVIRLLPEFLCFSLWSTHDGGGEENIDPASLPISDTLKSLLNDLEYRWDETFNSEYPPDSKFINAEAEEEFRKLAQLVYEMLTIELGSSYQIIYRVNI